MTILHGSNIVASRKQFAQIIDSFKGEKIRLEGKTLKLVDLKQALESRSLFDDERMVIVEGLFSRVQSQEKTTLLNYLKENQGKNLIAWEPKAIDGRKLISFKNSKILKLDLTSFMFKFLDSLIPGNQKTILYLLHQTLKHDSAEMVFYMLIRQVRLLIVAKDLGEEGLEKMAPWQKKKLTSQAENFTMETLLDLHGQLLDIDYKQKTGQNRFDLSGEIDLIILNMRQFNES
ncbi:hypothetical protein ACFL0Y_00400 [Patescibacteria group bacterium]